VQNNSPHNVKLVSAYLSQDNILSHDMSIHEAWPPTSLARNLPRSFMHDESFAFTIPRVNHCSFRGHFYRVSPAVVSVVEGCVGQIAVLSLSCFSCLYSMRSLFFSDPHPPTQVKFAVVVEAALEGWGQRRIAVAMPVRIVHRPPHPPRPGQSVWEVILHSVSPFLEATFLDAHTSHTPLASRDRLTHPPTRSARTAGPRLWRRAVQSTPDPLRCPRVGQWPGQEPRERGQRG
jgi:hypothetical protein